MGGWVSGGAHPSWNVPFSHDLLSLDASTHNSPQISALQTGASQYSGLFLLAGGPR